MSNQPREFVAVKPHAKQVIATVTMVPVEDNPWSLTRVTVVLSTGHVQSTDVRGYDEDPDVRQELALSLVDSTLTWVAWAEYRWSVRDSQTLNTSNPLVQVYTFVMAGDPAMSDKREPSGVTVYPVTRPSDEPSMDPYCLGVNMTTGEVYLIFRGEGVTYAINHAKPWRWNDFNAYARFYTVLEMLDLADWSDPRDLADEVRVFGARLDSNFNQARFALTDDQPCQKDYNEEFATKFVLPAVAAKLANPSKKVAG